MELAVFCVVAPCGLVQIYRRLRSVSCLMMEAAGTSETSVNFHQTSRTNISVPLKLHFYLQVQRKPKNTLKTACPTFKMYVFTQTLYVFVSWL
jgi:hypothetical protein